MPVIYSTLTSDQLYTKEEDGGANVRVTVASVLIKGGAGVVKKDRIETPNGVATVVSDQELEVLRGNFVFQMHERNGFIVVASDGKTDAESIDKVVADMERRDKSAPTVPEDFEAEDLPKPKTKGPGRPRKD